MADSTSFYSDQLWPLPAPSQTLKRSTFRFRDDFGNVSFDVTAAESVDVFRARQEAAGFIATAGIIQSDAYVLANQELNFVINPVVDPTARVNLVDSASQGGEPFFAYLAGCIADLLDEDVLDTSNRPDRTNPFRLAETVRDAILPESDLRQFSYEPLWEDALEIDPAVGSAHLVAAVHGGGPGTLGMLAIAVESTTSNEVLAWSDPMLMLRLENGLLVVVAS